MAHRGLRILLGSTLAAAALGAGGVWWSAAPASAEATATKADAPLPEKIDFNRDVRPILSENCFACHGPDKNKRKADLRLDTKEGLLFHHDDVTNVVAGHPEKSELFRRVTTDDADERMPDPKSTKRLTPREIAVLKKWIEQGGEYKGHWAYLKPTRPAVPAVDEPGFVRNPIDRFILARLKEAGLSHAPEADRATLLRRVSFDLTGLPPTPAEVEAFEGDKSPDAYEKVVDRLLASPHYGERMAEYWLDLVRYADSIGYHSDNPMNVSPYRDYVIHAFNTNKPFDQFTTEQLAGDLLANPTTEQKVATAYNRLLQTTEEGGAQAKEYEQKYLADRVRNYSTVWLAATMGCSQCHDHKFDPFTQKDFYSMGAFFADVQEATLGRREPGMPVPSGTQAEEIKKLDESLATAKKTLETSTPELEAAQAEWEKAFASAGPVEWQTLKIGKLSSTNGVKLVESTDGVIKAEGATPAKTNYTIAATTDLAHITGLRLEALDDDALPSHGPGASPNGNFVLTEFKAAFAPQNADHAPKPQPVKFARASADHSQQEYPIAHAVDGNNGTGWAVLPQVGKAHTAVFEPTAPIGEPGGVVLTVTLEFQSQFPQHSIGKFRLSATTAPTPAGTNSLPAKVRDALAVAAEQRTNEQKNEIAAHYRTIAPLLQPARDEVASIEKKKDEVLKSVPKCLVTTSGNPRTVRVLARGNWLDDSGAVMSPDVPDFLAKVAPVATAASADAAGGKPSLLTRLDLAKWTVSKENPLTSRVYVNRLWKLYFGQGICKVLDDLGSQGEWPTHLELLDWMAVEFMDSGWDVKHMVRLLVTSGTYRQSSTPSAEQKEIDPYNRLYARQSRFRLDAEMVRDNALSISGLLVDKQGGPSVFPYQPAGYWFALNFPPREWKNDAGEGLYRRGLYTHWQRSFLHPSLLAFDAPSREEAVCERSRSNIPQQALVLLNDPTYVEAARTFAERIVKEGGSGDADRIRWAFHQALSRDPTAEEARVLADLYARHHAQYSADKAEAEKLLKDGNRPAAKDIDPPELAAWTSVARTILNLNEALTRY